jgi:hypothetical protein
MAMAGPRETREFVWHDDARWFGGFSAIEVLDDGQSFLTLSDRGVLVRGQFVRDPDGVIVDMIIDRADELRSAAGGVLDGAYDDSEGLALADDGTLYISFEGVSRVRIEDNLPRELPRIPVFDGFERNRGFEAVAVTPAGAVLAIPEDMADGGGFPVWRLVDRDWEIAFVIPRDGAFLPVGADVGPDGLLYVLERALTGPGFRSRVRVFGLDGSGGVVVFESGTGLYDNLEGISVWADATGTVMTMISDDNFRFFQQTEVVEVRLGER